MRPRERGELWQEPVSVRVVALAIGELATGEGATSAWRIVRGTRGWYRASHPCRRR
jgi:hypothetical protein